MFKILNKILYNIYHLCLNNLYLWYINREYSFLINKNYIVIYQKLEDSPVYNNHKQALFLKKKIVECQDNLNLNQIEINLLYNEITLILLILVVIISTLFLIKFNSASKLNTLIDTVKNIIEELVDSSIDQDRTVIKRLSFIRHELQRLLDNVELGQYENIEQIIDLINYIIQNAGKGG